MANAHQRSLGMFLKAPDRFRHAEEVRFTEDRRRGRMWAGYMTEAGRAVQRRLADPHRLGRDQDPFRVQTMDDRPEPLAFLADATVAADALVRAARICLQAMLTSAILSNDVRRTMKELKADFPDGVDFDIVYDPTRFVKKSIEAVVETLLEAILLVVIVVCYLARSQAVALMQQSVRLAQEARDAFCADAANLAGRKRPLVAASGKSQFKKPWIATPELVAKGKGVFE